jgi:signal transduction histidine kinase
MNTIINQWIEVSAIDPDDARRRKLLNILLVGTLCIAIVGLLVAIVFTAIQGTDPGVNSLYVATISTSVGILITYLINRYWSGQLAASLFLLLLTIALTISDTPIQLVEGRSTFLFTVPIIMASVILRPWASFAMAALSSIVVTLLTFSMPEYIPHIPPAPTLLGFFAVALVSWLAARTLEGALQDLRAINRELDHRVEQRTRELQEANLQLEEANEHLRELDRLKSHFVSMVSHELRTPLTSVQGYAEMLKAGIYGSLSEKQTQALERILINTRQLIAIVNDLLDQARIEAGQLSLHPAPLSPRKLANDVQATMQPLAEEQGLELTTSYADDVPKTLLGDQQRLQQILVNLINNAIKFTPEGEVNIHIYCPDAEHWALQISDTGRGIPEDAVDYIFEPFRQVDGSVTRSHKGIGLGLSIVKQLVDLMEGSITVESQVGEGSTFRIELPVIIPQKESV